MKLLASLMLFISLAFTGLVSAFVSVSQADEVVAAFSLQECQHHEELMTETGDDTSDDASRVCPDNPLTGVLSYNLSWLPRNESAPTELHSRYQSPSKGNLYRPPITLQA